MVVDGEDSLARVGLNDLRYPYLWIAFEIARDLSGRARLDPKVHFVLEARFEFVEEIARALSASAQASVMRRRNALASAQLAPLSRATGFPVAHTCFNRVDLPLYESFDELKHHLELSIHLEVVGFTLD